MVNGELEAALAYYDEVKSLQSVYNQAQVSDFLSTYQIHCR